MTICTDAPTLALAAVLFAIRASAVETAKENGTSVIRRNLEPTLTEVASYYPVIQVAGPRQAGKTTLCRNAFPGKSYVSLESLAEREFAQSDPKGFLREFRGGAIIDEVQHAPGLLSYLQVEVDERPEPGRFVLTGSRHFGVTHAVAQSLAGRVGVLQLLPLALDEVRRFDGAPDDLATQLFTGGYPRIYDHGIPPGRWLADYVSTYVQRDVREVLKIGDVRTFTRFLRLCAGRTAQLLNLSGLGADAGISHNTAKAWLSVLEESYICFLVPAWHRNMRKRLIKAPKLHFFDTGLLCHLIGIREPAQVTINPLRGAIFETWVASEAFKARAHVGKDPDLHHYRDAKGHEVDLIVEDLERILAVEAKSGQTYATDFAKPLSKFADVAARADLRPIKGIVVYGGQESWQRKDALVVPWDCAPSAF